MMFVEKYRPVKFADVIGQDAVVKPIAKYIKKNKIIPHLLFSGPAGTGKTSLAIVVARKFYGEDWRGSLLELNASSDRGIDVIRNKVKEFARTKGFLDFKIVFLDEASEITKDAQHALRRLMETNHDNCRFILSCNYPEKIIDPIKSRCMECDFRPIKKRDLKELAVRVIKAEKIKINKGKLKVAILGSNGDARRLLNTLEGYKNGLDISEQSLDDIYNLDVSEFVDIAYKVDPDYIFNVMVEEVMGLKNKKAVLILAQCDMRMRNGTIKSLQLISAFIQIKKAIGG